MTNVRIGVMYDRDWAPEGLPEFARRAEALGVNTREELAAVDRLLRRRDRDEED